eukprot:2276620-Rhodomonas_salina.1
MGASRCLAPQHTYVPAVFFCPGALQDGSLTCGSTAQLRSGAYTTSEPHTGLATGSSFQHLTVPASSRFTA